MNIKNFTFAFGLLLLACNLWAQTPPYLSDWTMTFPTDVVLQCDNQDIPAPLTKSQILTNTGDDLWGMNVEDEIYDIAGVDGDGACYKILRTYTFINWETIDITHTEIGIVNRPHGLILNEASRVQLRHRSLDFGENDFGDEDDADPYDEQTNVDDDGALILIDAFDNPQQTEALFARSYTESINGNTVFGIYAQNYGHFSYRQIIKIVDTDSPLVEPIPDTVFCDTTGICAADIFLAPPVVTECSDFYFVDYTVVNDASGNTVANGVFPNGAPNFDTIFINNLPLGDYTVTYLISDGCGNAEEIIYTITVKDCLAPSAVCISGLAINLSEEGTAEIWAADFDASSVDLCSEPISLSLSSDPTETSRSFSCQDLGTQLIQLWAHDAVGNSGYCTTFLVVQDTDPPACTFGSLVSGSIQTERSEGIENVKVTISGQEEYVIHTGIEGTYPIYTHFELGYDYSFVAEKDDNPTNGLSMMDLVLMRKHILGIEWLDSPYKMIAADVDRSGAITMSDAIELIKVMLEVQDTFSNNTSWRFIDATYVFPHPAYPWLEAFPEVINYNNIVLNNDNFDFVGFKVGDLDGSATPNSGLVGLEERNTSGVLSLNIFDKKLEAGQEYVIPISLPAENKIEGLQMKLNWNTEQLEVLEIEEKVLTNEYFNDKELTGGTLPIVWVGEYQNEELLHLIVRPKADVLLSEVLYLDGFAEAYTASGEWLEVQLDFRTPSVGSSFLATNTPNPFEDITTLYIELPESQFSTLTVVDFSGKVVFEQSAFLENGRQQIPISTENWSSGLYYYYWNVGGEVVGGKMVKE